MGGASGDGSGGFGRVLEQEAEKINQKIWEERYDKRVEETMAEGYRHAEVLTKYVQDQDYSH